MSLKRMKGVRPPAELKLCRNCGRKLRPHYAVEWRQVDYENADGSPAWEVEPFFTGEIWCYGGNGCGDLFCSQTCGVRFAIRCVRAGVKLDRLDSGRAPK